MLESRRGKVKAARRPAPRLESLEERSLLTTFYHLPGTAPAIPAHIVSTHPSARSEIHAAVLKHAAVVAPSRRAEGAAAHLANGSTKIAKPLTQLMLSPYVTPATEASNSPIPYSFSPTQLRTAYGVAALPNQGAGVTIGIVDEFADPNLIADVNAYSTQYGLPLFNTGSGPTAVTVNDTTYGTVANSPTSGSNDTSGESSLDIDMIHAMAPQANIVMVFWPSVSTNAQFAQTISHAIQVAASTPVNGAPVVAVSASYGSGEFSGENSATNDTLATGNASTMAITVSTGDSGSASWPAVSSNVIAVGGTALFINSARGHYQYETAWGDLSGDGAGGGGTSTIYAAPTYQTANGVNFSNRRTVPDVSMEADPATAVSVYDSWDQAANGGSPWTAYGGTSVAAPLFAGVVALAQQDRILASEPILNSVQIDTAMYAAYNSPAYSTDFHDIILGNNYYNNGRRTTVYYTAAAGYDRATGIGSPIANNLVPYLAAQ